MFNWPSFFTSATGLANASWPSEAAGSSELAPAGGTIAPQTAYDPFGGGSLFGPESYESAPGPSLFDATGDWGLGPTAGFDAPDEGYGVLLPEYLADYEPPQAFDWDAVLDVDLENAFPGGEEAHETERESSLWQYAAYPVLEAGETVAEAGEVLVDAAADLVHTLEDRETAVEVARDAWLRTDEDISRVVFDPVVGYGVYVLPELIKRYGVQDLVELTAPQQGKWRGGVRVQHVARPLPGQVSFDRAARLEEVGLDAGSDTTYRLEVRSYAPFERFGDYVPIAPAFEGDARGPEAKADASSRVQLYLEFDPMVGVRAAEIRSHTSEMFETDSALVNRALGLGRDLGVVRDKARGNPGAVAVDRLATNGELLLMTRMWGANPLLPSPDINVNTVFRVSLEQGTLRVDGFQFGDGFPNSDIVLIDSSGHAVLLHSFETAASGELGPAVYLPGAIKREMGEFRNVIPLLDNGGFDLTRGDS